MDNIQTAKIFKALSNSKRLEIFLEIAKRQEKSYKTQTGCFVSEIAPAFHLCPSTISHHLKELSNAGLITTERKGKFLVAKVNEKVVDEVKKIINIL